MLDLVVRAAEDCVGQPAAAHIAGGQYLLAEMSEPEDHVSSRLACLDVDAQAGLKVL